MVMSMEIDDKRILVLPNITKNKSSRKIVESDHNPMFLKLNIPWNHLEKKEKERGLQSW